MSDEEIAKEVLSRKPGTIRTKQECYALYRLSHFGNKALAWDTYEELSNSNWKGKVCIRSKTGMARRKVVYNIPFKDVKKEIRRFERGGVSEESLSFNQSMPDSHLTIQGEVMRGFGGLELTYTTVQKPMNQALTEKRETTRGIKAYYLLRRYLCPSSYSDLEALLGKFDNGILEQSCVVEFSAYDVNVGDIPNRNTVIWEVRNY